MKPTLLFCILLILPVFIKAQEFPPLVGDRPDVTESSSVVPKHSLQIEAGFNFAKEKDSQDIENTTTLGTVLLRYGLFQNAELRLGTDLSQVRNVYISSDSTLSGISPLTVGTKVYITEEDRWIPEIALIASVGIPKTGKKEFQTTSLTPAMILSLSNTLTEKLSIGYNFGAEWRDIEPGAEGVYSISAAYSPKEKTGIYAELFGSFGKGQLPNNGFDAGLTYQPRHNFQLDLFGGFGFTNPNKNFFLGFGFILRIPN